MAILGGFRVSGLTLTGAPGGILAFLARSPMIPLNFTLPVAGPVSAALDVVPQQCQVGNDGIQLVVYVVDENGDPISVLDATEKDVVLLKPDGTTLRRAAEFLTSGVDGALVYAAEARDLAQVGTYEIQAEYVIDGRTQTTRRARFRVGANIED